MLYAFIVPFVVAAVGEFGTDAGFDRIVVAAGGVMGQATRFLGADSTVELFH